MVSRFLLLFAIFRRLGEEEVIDVVVSLQGAGGPSNDSRRAFSQMVAHLKAAEKLCRLGLCITFVWS